MAETRRAEDDAPFWHSHPWSDPKPYVRLVEIMQCRGNQEREVMDDVRRGWRQNNNASAQVGLARGSLSSHSGGKVRLRR